MKHVIIRPNEHGGMQVLVDGTDVSGWVNNDGLVVEIANGVAKVLLPVSPVMFSGAFPGAVVNALATPGRPDITFDQVRLWVHAMEDLARIWSLTTATRNMLAALREILKTEDGSEHL